jgi:hypothetical protein
MQMTSQHAVPVSGQYPGIRAGDLEAHGQLHDVVLVDDGIRLRDRVLVEDDATAIGCPEGGESRSWFEPLVPGARIRKILVLDDDRARSASLTWCGTEADGNEAALHIAVNGIEIVRPPTSQVHPQCRHYYTTDWGGSHFDNWFVVALPVGALQVGANTVEMWCDAQTSTPDRPAWEVMVGADSERYRGSDPPLPPVGRSTFSDDGGSTWDTQRLGRAHDMAGEYCVRLSLERHRRSGVLRSGVIDATTGGKDDGGSNLHRHLIVSQCDITCDVDTPEGTQVDVRVRFADTPRGSGDGWSEWEKLVDLHGSRLSPPGRWLQLEVELSTEDPLVTPILRGFHVEANVEVPQTDPGRQPHMLESRNGRALPSSFDYTWERPEMLADLRERFELDAVVAGATTEFEAQLRLMNWAYRIPLGNLDRYAWRYHDLPQLERDEDGAIRLLGPYAGSRREGHCLYCNLTLVAALLSFGYAARWVNISTKHTYGHEVTEVWSNDFGKWVHLDATRDFYVYDAESGIPLSLTEIAEHVGRVIPEPVTWERPIQAQVSRIDPEAAGLGCRQPGHGHDILFEGGMDLLQMIGHLQMPMRNDFASRPQPVPWRVSSNWGSSEFVTWHSERFPPKLEYERTTDRLQDWEPALNEARVHLIETATPGQLLVEVETVTPWFETFEASVDHADWQDQSDPVWTWDLHEGVNRLRVRACNRFGVRGTASEMTVVHPS